MWARIESGAVRELTDLDPAGRFHPSIQWVACPEGTEVGDAYANGAFSRPEKSIAERQEEVWELIKAERVRHEDGGVLVNGLWFHTDIASRIKLAKLELKAKAMLDAGGTGADVISIDGEPVNWKAYGAQFTPMTAQLAIDIAAAVEVLDARTFKAAETHRQTMLASSTPETYNYSAGWPAIYQPPQ